MQNLELKAVFRDIEGARFLALNFGAEHQWTREQKDTYFKCDHGKLKLREVSDKPAELISYHRPEVAQAKISDYNIYKVNEPQHLKKVLAAVLPQTVVVKKQRDLYLWKNVRIHVDKVDTLGVFIEFEAVIDEMNGPRISQERIDLLTAHFGIKVDDKIKVGYFELLESQK